MSDHLHGQGPLALGSRMREVSDRLFAVVDGIYADAGLDVGARWFPVLSLLAERGPRSVTEIAKLTGLSHPYVISITRKMAAAGYLTDTRDPHDERRRLVHLTDFGVALLDRLRPIWDGLREVVTESFERIGVDLVDALHRFESDLRSHPWPEAMAGRSARKPVQIVDFDVGHAGDFKRLNVEWIEELFAVESVDLDVLDAPVERIIEPGGVILFASVDDEIVGTCALRHEGDGVYELTKMGVTRTHRGVGVGAALLQAAISRFLELGGRTLYLETNHTLTPAIHLYERFGFVRQEHRRPGSVYQRSDVFMIWSGQRPASGAPRARA